MQYGDEGQFGGGRFNRDRRGGSSSGGRFGGSRDGGFSPVKVGEELDVTIEAVGEKGDGIAKKNGFVIFVPGVQQGDTVKIRITKVFKKMAFAEVIGEGSAPAEQSEESGDSEGSEESEESEETEEETEDSEEF
jgi:predicted RNA-binding protein with TRAM domain